jgi:transcriptional regulator with XRE-family HTH domain
MDLGSYVSERRKKLGLVQSSLAEELHYSVQAISRFEQGQSQLSLSVLPHLADLLQESFDDLLHCVADPAPFSGTNKPIDEAAFAENLLAARKGKGLSQKDVASKLGIGERSLQNYEKGNSLPSPDVALAMADFFLLAPSSFFCEKIAQGASVIKVKKGWRLFVLPALVIVVVGGGGVGIAYGLGAFWKGAGSGSTSGEPTSETTSGDSQTTGDTSSTSSATSSPTSSSTNSTSSSSDPSSSSSSSDPASSSSSGSTSSEDAYPGFPGLKSLKFLSTDGSDLAPGDHTVNLVSEPATYFTGLASTNSLAFSVSFDGVSWPTHTGISYSQKDTSDPYSPISLTIASEITDNVKIVFEFSSTYNHHTLSSNPVMITLNVDNPNGYANTEYFPGLKSFTATVSSSSNGPFSPQVTGDPGTYYLSYTCSPSDYIQKALADPTSYYLSPSMPSLDKTVDPYALSYSSSDVSACAVPIAFTVPDGAPEGKSYQLGYELHSKLNGYMVHTLGYTPFSVHYSA